MKADILIIDDDKNIRAFLGRLLKRTGYTFTEAASAEEAREMLKKQAFELVLCDIIMPGESGLDFARFALSEYPQTAAVMITGQDDPESAKNAIDIGAYDYITKPFERERVTFSVANALKRRELSIANRSYREDLERMVSKRTAKLQESNAKLRKEISARMNSQKVLRESEQRYRLLINNIPGFFYKVYKDWSVEFIDNKFGELTGYDKKMFDDRTLKWSDIIFDEDLQDVTQSTRQTLKKGNDYIREYRVKTKSGETLWIQDRGQVVRNEKGEIEYFSGIFFDINERKQAKEALLESKQIIEEIINAIPVRVFWKDENLVYLGCNALFAYDAGFAGPKDIIGKDDYQMVWHDQAELYRGDDRQVIESDEPKMLIEEPQTTPEGDTITLLTSKVPLHSATGEITGILGTYMDITNLKLAEEEKKRIEAQLLQSEKMASIGQLAAGVAHEINNPTGFVSSNLKSLSDYIKDLTGLTEEYHKLIEEIKQSSDALGSLSGVSEQVRRVSELEEEVDLEFVLKDIIELIEESKGGIERIKKIVRDLKDFAHPGEDKPKFANINDNMDSTLNVVWNELKYKANVSKDYGDLPQVKCYPQMLNQVFMNLLVNAAQSIEKHGEIKIKTLANNGHVEIMISDTGSGIPKENLSKIFDPFFTTKKVGKGTGLGLNVVYNIIKKHHGEINVTSSVGKGTTFTIRIPVAGIQIQPLYDKKAQ
jgi:PAS domain S-box-containing protein